MKVLERVRRLPLLPPRRKKTHKGDYGRILVIASSTGLTGAGCMAAFSALRGGAGLVTLAVPESLYPIFASKLTSPMPRPLSDGGSGFFTEKSLPEALRLSELNDVLALGPGIGTESPTVSFLLALLEKVEKPLVIDADALNIIASNSTILEHLAGHSILTPHPGEMARLASSTPQDVEKRRLFVASNFASVHNLVVLLKGYGTIVTDGKRYYLNRTGNPGMATAGCGDILTGVVAAFVGQGLSLFEAAQLGAYIHGLAGDLAAGSLGEVSLVAEDIMSYLPRAFLLLARRRARTTLRRKESRNP